MGIDVSAAYARAGELRVQAQYLRDAKSSMTTYKSIFGVSWVGDEVKFYKDAVYSVETRLLDAATALDSLASTIQTTADQIRQEEIEYEQYLAWLAEQERIQKELEENQNKITISKK